MSGQPNGEHQASRDRTGRLRFDGLTSIASRRALQTSGSRTAVAAELLPRGHSGRRFVLVAGVSLLVIWGVLFVLFRDWRSRYRARAAYGAARVAAAIEPLEALVPPDVRAEEWRDAVRQTRAMLITVTGSNLLDIPEMERLSAELEGAVVRAQAHPDAGPGELAAIWNEMAERAEFLFRDHRSIDGARHRRPRILAPEPEKPRGRTATGTR
jgi:hypothetical protein